MLAEATCLKQWTIPFGAYVLLNAGEIEAAKLHEVGNDVSVLLVNRVGDYLLVWVNPAEKYFSFASGLDLAYTLGACATAELKADGKDPRSPEGEHFSNEFRERFELGLKILLASIIRDFRVIEERQRVFGASLEIKKSARLRGDRGKPQTVYLPRIRYVGDCHDRLDDLN